MSLSAAQVIYTNVEKKDSPSKRDGYQIWLRTPNVLDAADEIEIEKRLGDFEERRDLNGEESARHIYFTLPSGRAVIGRAVPLAQTDKFHRGGRFYAHAYIVEPSDFARFGNNPFAILDQVSFQSTPDDGKKQGDASAGTIPSQALKEHLANPVSTAIPRDKLLGFIPALLRVFIDEKPLMIGLPGTPAQALGLLREVFELLPPSLRLKCSFDTLSGGGRLAQIPFAFVGLPASGPTRRYTNLVLFDPVRHIFLQPLLQTGPGLYERWLTDRLRKNADPPRISESESAYHLCTCLDRGIVNGATLSNVDAALFEEIACSDAGIAKSEWLLRNRLDADVGDALAIVILTLAQNWLRSAGVAGMRSLAEPIPPPLLYRWLLATYEQPRGEGPRHDAEMAGLKDVIEKHKLPDAESLQARRKLALIYHRKTRSWSKLARTLRDNKLTPDDIYGWFVDWIIRSESLKVSMGSGVKAGGGWCGPAIVCHNNDDAEKLVGALFGIDPIAGEEPGLSVERWTWLVFELMRLIEAPNLASVEP